MRSEEARLREIQELAFHVMDDIHLNKSKRDEDDLKAAVDNLSRAVGMFSDPHKNVSLDYVEEKVVKAHQLIVKSKRKVSMVKVK
ncbi:hypothetical protein [Alkalihalobacillus sp. AL-G]|uniref:hypothetical protein n=1 Tax=Alkalihalobacillus sp. AL-G TaxID=2926399 RepID=UPI00272CF34A|nr:hypothetical protein [Alkalihalobacillus sp. AL-G]WLD94243.1 hypothetical protein MOJ78_04950 [Alkalihalobacillus sp. AL-G]